MTNFLEKYQSVVRQLNYTLFLVTVALLPFPQIFLRYAIVAWFVTWVLEGRFCSKPSRQDWHKAIPFLIFGGWYLWKIISGIWASDKGEYCWQLERYMAFGSLVPIGIWGVNKYYDWKQVCRVLVVSCIAAAGIYLFTIYWVYNANIFTYRIGTTTLQDMNLEFFAEKISYIKHRLFLCSVEMMGIMALLYIRRDIVEYYGKIKGWIMIIIGIMVMSTLIIATGSRASIISSGALISIGLLYKLPIRKIRYKIAFLLLAGGLGLFVLSQHPRMEDFEYKQLLSIRDINNNNVRLNIWGAALDSPKDYSLHGLGAGQSYNYLQNKYKEKGLCYANLNAHNQYIEEWIEGGIIGLILFILAWLSIPYCNKGVGRRSAILLCALYMLNMLTDCMFGRFDGIAIWCIWMILIRLQSDTESHEQATWNA